MRFEISPLGDSAVRISFGDTIDEKINKEITVFFNKLEQARVKGIIECVPAYTTLTVYYEPDVISYKTLINQLKTLDQIPVEKWLARRGWIYQAAAAGPIR